MTAKNPDADIAASVALDGGYNPCDNSSFYSQKRRKRQTSNGCDSGFIPDTTNDLCYMALTNLDYLDDGATTCQSLNGAELLYFETDAEVQGFLNILKSGKIRGGK